MPKWSEAFLHKLTFWLDPLNTNILSSCVVLQEEEFGSEYSGSENWKMKSEAF